MYLGNASQANSNPAPPQPVGRSQPQRGYDADRQTTQYRDENNVSPVSFSAERFPVSPMSSTRVGSRKQSQHGPPAAGVPVRRNAVRRRNTEQGRPSHYGLGIACANKDNTVLPPPELRRKKAQTFDQRPWE